MGECITTIDNTVGCKLTGTSKLMQQQLVGITVLRIARSIYPKL